MKTTRRDFFKLAATTVGAVGVSGVISTNAEASSGNRPFPAESVSMLYDSTKCVGCQACVSACYRVNFLDRSYYIDQVIPYKDQNFIMKEDLIPKLAPQDEFNPERPWLNVVTNDYRFRNVIQKYKDENGKDHFIKHQCMHCSHPGCVSACPVKALTKDPIDGVVSYDETKCIGCRYCQMACPFNIPKFEWDRAIPKITKCDMCKSTLWVDKIGNPEGTKKTACTDHCPAGAVIFGLRADLMADAKARIAASPDKYYNNMVYGEEVYGGTGVIYLSAANVSPDELGFPAKLANYSYANTSETLQHTIYKWGIAPIALYTALAVIGYRNNKKHHDSHEGDK